eukprot:2941257-Pleurochrysis_carterae.AAC.4
MKVLGLASIQGANKMRGRAVAAYPGGTLLSAGGSREGAMAAASCSAGKRLSCFGTYAATKH